MKKTILCLVLVLGLTALAAAAKPLRVKLIPMGTYSTGIFDDGAAQIVDYHAPSRTLYVTNVGDETIDVLEISPLGNPRLSSQIALSGPPLSVAINPVLDLIAVSIEADEATDPGTVQFFDIDGQPLGSIGAGPLPDMVVWTPDGTKLLVANEGEPTNTEYEPEVTVDEDGTEIVEEFVDPEGSISIITLGESGDLAAMVAAATEVKAGFDAFDKEELLAKGVRIFGPDATVAQDIEPEYITIAADSATAWVTLQENNAVAVIDIAAAQIADIFGFGTKNHMLPGNGLDASNKDKAINIQNWPVQGMYQPDGIANYTASVEVDDEIVEKTFLVTANEGDARDFSETRAGKLDLADYGITAAIMELQENEYLGRLKLTTEFPAQTDDEGNYLNLISYGGRSFSIWDDEGNLVFDSGDDFEQIMADEYPDVFNSTDDETAFDNRSDDKGPEPEDVELAAIGQSTIAFISLERMGGIMTYDITDPTEPRFLDYVNNRDFSEEPVLEDADGNESTNPKAGDLSTEGMIFISAADSPTGQALLAVANEVSGTTTVFTVVTKGHVKKRTKRVKHHASP